MSIVSDIEIRLRADIARLQQDMTQARQSVSRTMDSIRNMAGGAAKALAAIGGAMAVGAFASWIKGAIDAVDAIGDISPATGVAIQDIAGLQLAMQFGGLEATEFEKTFIKLSTNIANSAAVFDQLKVATRDAVTGEMRKSKDVLYDVADAFAAMEDGTAKTALAVDTFGKTGAALIPMLNNGSEGLREMAEMADALGLSFTEDGVQAAGDFNDSLDTLLLAGQGVARQLAMQMLPALNDIAGAMATTAKEGNNVGKTADVIGVAFKGIYTAGVVVVEVFKTIGTVVGAQLAAITGGFGTVGRVLKAFIEGEYSQAWTIATTESAGHVAAIKGAAADIGDSWGNAAAKISSVWSGSGGDVLAGLNAQMKAAKGAKAAADDAKKSMDDALKARAKLEAEAAKRAAAEAKEAERLAEAYAGMVQSIEDRIDATEREANGLKPLTDAQQLSRDLDRQLLSGKTVLTAEQIRYYRALITTLGVQEDAAEANKQAIEDAKDLARANKEMADAEIQKQKDLWGDIEQTARDTFRSITDGSKDTAQRLKETFKNVFFDWLYQMTLKKWIIQLKPVSAGGGGLLDAATEAFGKSGGGMNGLVEAGKTIFSSFSSGFKSFTSGLGQAVSTLGSKMGSNAVFSFGQGMQGYSAAGVGQAGGSAGAASAGGSFASSIPIIGAVVAGMMANNKFFDDGWRLDTKDIMSSQRDSYLKGNGFAPLIMTMTASMNVFEKAMKGLGVNAKFASMLSGSSVFARAFGRKQATVEATGFEGTLSASGFDGKAFAEMFSKGGWFRSDKRSTTTQALDSAQDKAFDSTIKSVADSVRSMGAVLGLEASRIDGYSKQIKITLGKDEAENQKLIEAAFGGLADDLSTLMLPSLAEFATSGETASTTLQRVAGNFQMVTAALDVLGVTSQQAFGAIGVASLAARERLVALAGGVEALASQTNFFAQNFMTEAERLAPVQRMVSEQLAVLGRSGIATADDFKAAVLGLATSGELATEEGAKTYAGLLALAPAFKMITDATTVAAQKLTDEAAELAQKVLDERQGLQDEYDQLTMTSGELLDKQRDALYESNRELFNNIQAVKAQSAALVAASEAIANAKAAAISTAAGLMTGVDGAFSALQQIANREKDIATTAHNTNMAYIQAQIDAQTEAMGKHKALSDAIKSTLNSMKVDGTEGMDRANAQGQLRAALAAARAGAMPLVETLKDSLSVLSRDSSDLFDSMQDYQRDFYRTQNDLIALGNLSDAALSVEERTLRALMSSKETAERGYAAQIAGIDSMVLLAQAELDQLKGISTNGVTLIDAMNALKVAVLQFQENTLASSTAKIAQAYKDNLARTPDAAGMEFWKDKIAGGVDTQAVLDGIKNSAEAQVQSLYRELLGRNADAGGLDWFLKSGASMDAIRDAIKQSPEYLNRVPPVYNAQQGSANNTGAMLTELQTLNGRMMNVETAMNKTAQATGQFATQFDNVSAGGEALLTESLA